MLFSLACITPIDLAFAFETTSSGENNFIDMKKLAEQLVDNFKVSAASTHISLSTFSDTPGYIAPFNAFKSADEVKAKIAGLKSDGGSVSNMGNFLEYANKEMFKVSFGVRQAQPRVLVIFTSGNIPTAQESRAIEAAKSLKKAGKDVSIMIVNVGGASQLATLNEIASKPSEAKVISVSDSRDLLNLETKQRIAEEICSGRFFCYKLTCLWKILKKVPFQLGFDSNIDLRTTKSRICKQHIPVFDFAKVQARVLRIF